MDKKQWTYWEPPSLERFELRGLSEETQALYQSGLDANDDYVFTCYQDGMPVGGKMRTPDKDMWWAGQSPPLYGKQACNSKWNLVITEGEFDAMAARQLLGPKFSCVSVTHGASGALKDITEDLEWVARFEKVFVCMDNDAAGQKAQHDVMQLLDPGLGYSVQLPPGIKDINEYLLSGETDLVGIMYSAQPRELPGLLSTEQVKAQALDCYRDPLKHSGLPTGYDSLDHLIGGYRPGEVLMVLSGTGVGKSTFVRQLAASLSMDEIPSLFITLEDQADMTGLRFAEWYLENDLVHDHETPADVVEEALDDVLEYIHIIDRVSYDDVNAVLKQIKYGVKKTGAQVVFLDHITFVGETVRADGMNGRQVFEYLCPRLKQLAKDLGVTMVVVSHMARDKEDKEDTTPSLSRLKGSTALGQMPDCVLGISRKRGGTVTRVFTLKASRVWARYGGFGLAMQRQRLVEVEDIDEQEKERVRGQGTEELSWDRPVLRDSPDTISTGVCAGPESTEEGGGHHAHRTERVPPPGGQDQDASGTESTSEPGPQDTVSEERMADHKTQDAVSRLGGEEQTESARLPFWAATQ